MPLDSLPPANASDESKKKADESANNRGKSKLTAAECVRKAAERAQDRQVHEDVLRRQASDRRDLHLKIVGVVDASMLRPGAHWWRSWETTTPTQHTEGVVGKRITGYTTELVALADQVRLWKARHEAREVRWSDAFVAKLKAESMFSLHSGLKQSDPQCALACSTMRKHLRRFIAQDGV
jgi:hypothetical protein